MFLFLSLFFSFSQAAQSEIGQLALIKGDVEVLHDQKLLTPKLGYKLFEGDKIQTKAQSSAKLVMNDRNIIVVTENTELKLSHYRQVKNEKQVIIDLAKGSARHALKQKYKNNEKYEVRTPVMVVGVRGTDFITKFDASSEDSVLCAIEGVVSLNLQNNKSDPAILVNSGNFVKIKKGDRAVQVIATDAAWLERALKQHAL